MALQLTEEEQVVIKVILRWSVEALRSPSVSFYVKENSSELRLFYPIKKDGPGPIRTTREALTEFLLKEKKAGRTYYSPDKYNRGPSGIFFRELTAEERIEVFLEEQ